MQVSLTIEQGMMTTFSAARSARDQGAGTRQPLDMQHLIGSCVLNRLTPSSRDLDHHSGKALTGAHIPGSSLLPVSASFRAKLWPTVHRTPPKLWGCWLGAFLDHRHPRATAPWLTKQQASSSKEPHCMHGTATVPSPSPGLLARKGAKQPLQTTCRCSNLLFHT